MSRGRLAVSLALGALAGGSAGVAVLAIRFAREEAAARRMLRPGQYPFGDPVDGMAKGLGRLFFDFPVAFLIGAGAGLGLALVSVWLAGRRRGRAA